MPWLSSSFADAAPRLWALGSEPWAALGVMEMVAAWGLGILIDAVVGDPPNRWHPVAWFGRFVEPWRRWIARGGGARSPRLAFVVGLVVAVGYPLAALWVGGLALGVAQALPGPLGPTLHFGLLVFASTTVFAVRGLGRAARELRDALDAYVQSERDEDLAWARHRLGALCSRDATVLGVGDLATGGVASVAENASDSAVAPAFWFAVGGLPAAWLYRCVNTLDACVGYRGRFEYFGKAAARVDDLLNWVPARLCSWLMLLYVGLRAPARAREGWAILRRDGASTPSPNGGRPMAAMAGVLGRRIDKPGTYVLGDRRSVATIADLDRAWSIAAPVMWGALSIAPVVFLLRVWVVCVSS